VAEISGATWWRWLSSDALRPWQHRSWIFPPDPKFADRAGPILDLYQRVWEGAPLGPDDYDVISAAEKTSIQARRRKQPTLHPAPHRLSVVKTSSSLQIKSFSLEASDVKRAVNATAERWSTRAINVGPMSLSPAAKLLISIAAGVLSTDRQENSLLAIK
jgi:hypothetical protein